MTGKAPWLASMATVLCSGPPFAQAVDPTSNGSRADNVRDETEEIVVRGQRLSDFRFRVEAARIRVYDLFNDLNSDDAFDVHCQEEDSTGTRMRQHICRPRFKDDISNAAARAWVYGIMDACPTGSLDQGCIFGSPAAAALAKSRALAEESWEPGMQERFAIEMARVVAANPEMQQAILDYEAVERAYEDARGGRRTRGCDQPEPPPRCSR